MHVMHNVHYALADGFIYASEGIFWRNVYPQEATLAYRIFTPNGKDYVSLGLAYKHEDDKFSKIVGRSVAYHRLRYELEQFNENYLSQYEANASKNEKWRFSNYLWKDNRILSFTVALDEMLNVLCDNYEIPRIMSPRCFRQLNKTQLVNNYTDQLFFDIVDTYVYHLYNQKGITWVK